MKNNYNGTKKINSIEINKDDIEKKKNVSHHCFIFS